MQLAEYLERDLVISDLSARTKNGVLAELVSPLVKKIPDFDEQAAVQTLLDREQLGTTGIGEGVAIPHGKMDALDRMSIVVGRSFEGVDFGALDHQPARIFFMILAPSVGVGLHLKILASVSRLLKDDAFRNAFEAASGPEGLWELLRTV